MQLATEIELYPEISVITRYLNIKLVNDNRAWISRLIELNRPTLDLIEKSGRFIALSKFVLIVIEGAEIFLWILTGEK